MKHSPLTARPPRLRPTVTVPPPTKVGDWIIFFDESGDALLERIDPNFPILNLTAVAVRITDYWDQIVPALQQFKRRHFQTDAVVLHASSIRRRTGAFHSLANPRKYDAFMMDLVNLLNGLPFRVISANIDKQTLVTRYKMPHDPYDLAMRFCLERVSRWLTTEGQSRTQTQLVFESRGKRPDRHARAFVENLSHQTHALGRTAPAFYLTPFEALFIPKRTNVAGLQLADLLAHPLARTHRHPETHRAVMAMIQPKLVALKAFPN